MFIDILVALAVVVVVSLVLGILLALFTRFFSVEENEKAKSIRACLPGINCGACGFKGCNDYSEALAEGKAAPNLCIPGAEFTAAKLGELLGIEIEEPKDLVAYVHCNGNCAVTSKKAVYDGITTCKASAMLFGGPGSCNYGCLGCGDCAAACVSNAICIVDGIAHIDTRRCVGCGLCVKTCPKNLISLIPQEAPTVVSCSNKDKGADARKVCKNACIGCKKCEKTCPVQAISVVNNCATIDYEKCTGCGLCVSECPVGCLHTVKFPDLAEEYSLV